MTGSVIVDLTMTRSADGAVGSVVVEVLLSRSGSVVVVATVAVFVTSPVRSDAIATVRSIVT